jgi:hypothetical protein
MIKTLNDLIGNDGYQRMQADPVIFIKAFETLTPWDYQIDTLRMAVECELNGRYKYRRVVISWPRQNAKSTLAPGSHCTGCTVGSVNRRS